MSQEIEICRCRECRHSVAGKAKYAEMIEGLMVVAKKEITRINLIIDVADVADVTVDISKIAIKPYQVELLILNAIVNPKSTKGLFTILLAKFDEVLRDSMELREGLVKENISDEVAYLRFCESIVSVRNNTIIMVNARIAADEEDEECLLSQ